MPNLRLPLRIERPRPQRELRSFPAHRAWVRRHHCSVPDCKRLPIECAHIRSGTDGGQGLKPSDCWTISLCRYHHAEQHRIGEHAFEKRYGIDLFALAEEFARRSPHRHLWASKAARPALLRRQLGSSPVEKDLPDSGNNGSEEPREPISRRHDDLEAQRRLISLSGELDDLSPRCWSTSSATALKAAAHLDGKWLLPYTKGLSDCGGAFSRGRKLHREL